MSQHLSGPEVELLTIDKAPAIPRPGAVQWGWSHGLLVGFYLHPAVLTASQEPKGMFVSALTLASQCRGQGGAYGC